MEVSSQAMPQYKEAYLQQYLDNFTFVDPECKDGRIREINQRTKRCNRCQGFDECKMHPHFWLYGQPERLDKNETLVEIEPRPPLPHDDEPTLQDLPDDEEVDASELPQDEESTLLELPH